MSAVSLPTRLRGRRVFLRPPVPRDYEALYELEVSGWSSNRWRYAGQVPSFESYVQQLWSGVHAQYLVLTRAENTPRALVAAYSPDVAHGHVYLAVNKFSESDHTGDAMHGAVLLIDHLFQTTSFRKIYLETASYNVDTFGEGLSRHLSLEGTFIDHLFHDGRYWDLLTYSLTRERWAELSEIVLPAVRWEDG